jgi:alkylhydroperoxidase family enzyme
LLRSEGGGQLAAQARLRPAGNGSGHPCRETPAKPAPHHRHSMKERINEMARLPLVDYQTASPEIQAAWDDLGKHNHDVTNMKATAVHSPVALHAILEWYALFDQVKPYLGERLAVLFCHAISRENACKLCWTFMRKEIIDGGEDPEKVQLDEREATIVEFGRQLAADPNRIGQPLFEKLQQYLTTTQIVELVTFGALMVVNNIFNSALQVDLDAHLGVYTIDPEQVLAQA